MHAALHGDDDRYVDALTLDVHIGSEAWTLERDLASRVLF